MADYSKCVEATAGYFNYYLTNNGHIFVQFDATGANSERIIGKEPDLCLTNACFYIEYMQLGCISGGPAWRDGSDGQYITVPASSCIGSTISYNLHKNPFKCLTADNTKSLTVIANNGHWQGTIKGYWGPG